MLLLLAGTAASGQAQVLRGRTIDARSETAVAEVAILIYRGAAVVGSAVSDSAGLFEIALPAAGPYLLAASAERYVAIGPLAFEAPADRLLDVVVRLDGDVVTLDALEVSVTRPRPRTPAEYARDRADRNRRLGIGDHLSREEIAASTRHLTTDLIASATPRIRVGADLSGTLSARVMGDDCTLATFIDGLKVSPIAAGELGSVDALITPTEIDRVEVYYGAVVRGGFYDPAGCGVVLIWSRTDVDASRFRFTWLGAGVLAGLLGLLAAVM